MAGVLGVGGGKIVNGSVACLRGVHRFYTASEYSPETDSSEQADHPSFFVNHVLATNVYTFISPYS